MPHRFSTIQNAVKAIAEGRVVIVVDDEDRENEGDFVCAAELITPEMVNFMLAGHGQLCCSILPSVAERLDLRPLVDQNTSPLSTAFMTPVDFAGCKTGITAAERAETIRRLARGDTLPKDFVKPGHVYPLLAKEGGVLRRAGHTEASVDLARMAGLTPSGVVCEILNRDGDRANR
ncbi:MAG: 3,4-dihydroxy-2-butanone-4-phosphate synthase, partial [Planctomycetota bacterium]